MKLFTFLFLFAVSTAFAQNVEFSKEAFPNDKAGLKAAKKNMDDGDNFYTLGHQMYRHALPSYLKANEFNASNALLNYKIGVCYLYSGQKEKSVAFLEKAFKLNKNVAEDIHFYLGCGYHLTMQFTKAIKEYQSAKTALKGADKEKSDDIDKRMMECKNGIELVKKPVKVTIDNIGASVNSPFPDYAPVTSADEATMMFTSRRENTTGGGVDPFDQQYFEDIYISTNTGNGWSEATNMGAPVNTSNRHDATVAVSADGQKLFIYLDDMHDGSGNIYECDLKGTEWDKPVKLGETINSKAHESSASLSADGSTLYFTSNREGGFGKHDIYKSKWDAKKNSWGVAENLGKDVNTPYEEHSVFIHPDGKTLFFSSEGNKSMGGFDIFKTVYDTKKNKWSKPENLGYPINSTDDDINFVISASGKHAYFSSYKTNGIGEKDIYVITYPDSVKSAVACVLKGTITDALTKQPLEADVELIDNTLNQTIASFKSNSATGKYLVTLPGGKNYGIAVKKDGYLFHSENFDIPETFKYQEYVKDVELKSIAVGSKIVLNNIFYDFDKATLRPESTSELERLMSMLKDMPTMKIEIAGHTDGKGADDYNLKLSQSRAQSVVDYLSTHGIDKTRLSAKGYGKTKPIASNDTDEGRQLNRRTEFEILSK